MSRTSHEVRGLKYKFLAKRAFYISSHLTRGAWIEILGDTVTTVEQVCRTSHEVRGLK